MSVKEPNCLKKMWIQRAMVPVVLGALGISVVADGSVEYAMMDQEYRGVVRFKEFHKFVKKYQAGTLF